MQTERDPLNLGSLPLVSPEQDGWPEIREALQQRQRTQRLRRFSGIGLAAAAVVTLALGLVLNQPAHVEPVPQNTATLDSLIALSQRLENGVRAYRDGMGGMPTHSLVYQIELEDLIAQVDDALSLQPDSKQLWSQRVNLLLDLSQLYEDQLRREQLNLASL